MQFTMGIKKEMSVVKSEEAKGLILQRNMIKIVIIMIEIWDMNLSRTVKTCLRNDDT
jgi:hypothetical protein